MISMRRGSIQLMRQEVWGYCTLVPDSTQYSIEGYICGSDGRSWVSDVLDMLIVL